MSASVDDGPLPVPSLEEQLRPPRTALAFALAPGIAALIGVVTSILVMFSTGNARSFGRAWTFGEVVAGALNLTMIVGPVGYFTMGLFAAPLYWILPQDVRDDPFAVPCFAGVAAAAPWLLSAVLFGPGALILAAIAFALGCVAGVAFVLIRGRVPGPAEGGRRDPAADAASPEPALANPAAAPYPATAGRQPGQQETAWSRSGPPDSPTTAG